MSGRAPNERRILLDACCLVNLYASRNIEAVLQSLPFRFGVVRRVMEVEATYVLVGGEGEDAEDREPVNLTPLLNSGLLEIVDIDTEDEAEAFVNLAFDLDDGEARTIAVAIHRGDIVATDDRKARQVVEHLVPPVMLISTTELLRQWSLAEGIAEDQIRRALFDIQQRGRFLPPRHDPLREWWQERVASGQ